MIKTVFSIMAAVCVAPCLAADAWIHDDFTLAQKRAAEQKKGILIEFTGSDWCRPCKELRKNVLMTPEFLKIAGKHFVPVELDYPQKKAQSPQVKAANEELAKRYRVGGFPTVVFADATGKPVGGFMGGKPKEIVMKEMAEALKRHKAIKAAEVKLKAAATDEAKIAALAEILNNAPEEYAEHFYGDVKSQLMKLDKNDVSGMKSKQEQREKLEKQGRDIQLYMRKCLIPGTTHQKALEMIRAYPDREKLLPEVQQRLLMMELHVTRKIDPSPKAIIPILDKVIAIDPNTDLGKQASGLKSQLK